MRNFDEGVLRSRAIDPRAPFAPVSQALRIALYEGYAARAFYRKVLEAFGPRAPFDALAKSEEKGLAALAALARRRGVPLPHDPFPLETALAPGWRANCERALVGEVERIRLYDSLLGTVGEPELRRILQRLQAECLDQRLPALRRAVAEALEQEALHARHGVAPEEAYVRHGLFADFLEKTFAVMSSQHGAIGVVGPLLRNTRPAMLAGAAAGAAGVLFAKSKLKLNEKKEG